ncbi:MAG: SAP domain-containing protein [Gallionellales bacterium GWA2_55_18]|nr:MAG: SAP domain-containing protein [Gallionellales bacterium GWA2_55_18]
MKMEEVRSIAKSHGISPGKFSKTELIKYIQANEGNFDCFATAYDRECDQADCKWRADCFEFACKGEPS